MHKANRASKRLRRGSAAVIGITALGVVAGAPVSAALASNTMGDEYPPFDKVTEGLTKVVSTTDGSSPFWDLYQDTEKGKLLAVLPRGYDKKLMMIACTVSGGDDQAGVMGPTFYVNWKKINNQLAMVAPNLSVRTDGDQQAQDSVEDLFTGRVIATLPIVSMAPGNRPVIDLMALTVQQAKAFFGPSIFGQYGSSIAGVNPRLAQITKAKTFPENTLIEIQAPDPAGRLVSLSYSFSALEGTPGFKPRAADARVGYFYNWHQDFARPASADVTERYITRWNIEKADPSLAMSPPKEPLVWYIEHTTPIQYRRYVREGIELWNKAFEAVGIVGALEVYQQDSRNGAHMDKDPEDARYNFFRWNVSNQGYAIGPSRANPYTGEILDADVVWHQGLTRGLQANFSAFTDDMTAQTFSPETLAWFEEHPSWDPRILLAEPAQRAQMLHQRALDRQSPIDAELGEREHPWSTWGSNHAGAACKIGSMLGMDLSLADAALAASLMESDNPDLLDGIPEEYFGPMIRYISAHEVGHCLGLQHNMAASTIRTNEEVNSEGYEGATIGSVMDYVAVNINHELGEVQGAYATPEVGPYDMWAIAFGYGPADQVDEVLSQSGDPDKLFLSQVGMSVGADPRNMTWDMGADNLEFCRSRLSLVQKLRSEIIDDIVDEGESWAFARRKYNQMLGTHIQAMSIASNYIGSSYFSFSHKGDADVTPIADVPAADQRAAFELVMGASFDDDAFGITPELVRHFGKEYWWDPQGMGELMADPSTTLHDLVGAIQGVGLTMVMNPTTLRRVYDNEYRTQGQDDVFTLDELVTTVTDRVWTECATPKRPASGEQMVSSFRRNLQREHVGRLTTLALLDSSNPSLRTIGTLAAAELKRVDGMAESALDANPDTYTRAHLEDIRTRIERSLDAAYVVAK